MLWTIANSPTRQNGKKKIHDDDVVLPFNNVFSNHS
jgi:hypothetical protein